MGRRRRKYHDRYDPDQTFDKELGKGLTRKAKEEFRKDHPGPWKDIEEQFREQAERLEEFEMQRLLRDGKIECLYRTDTTRLMNRKTGAEQIEVQIFPAYYTAKAVPGPKTGLGTRPAQKNLNDKRAKRRLRQLIDINFGQGDIWATFTWDDAHVPADMDAATKEVRNFLGRVKRLARSEARRKALDKGLSREDAKAAGDQAYKSLKYIYVLAVDGYTRPHVHLVISGDNVDRDALESKWTGGKRINTRRIQPDDDGHLTGMSEYMSQNPHGSKRWVPSKNLEQPPKPTTSYTKFSRAKVCRMAKNHTELIEQLSRKYPGYTIRDTNVSYNGINAAFYIYARMTRD